MSADGENKVIEGKKKKKKKKKQLSSGPGGLTFGLNLCSYFVCASSEDWQDWVDMRYVPKSHELSHLFSRTSTGEL